MDLCCYWKINSRWNREEKRLGIVTDIGIIESYFVLWSLPGYFWRDWQWALGPLELYSLWNMVRLGRFVSPLPPSRFLNLPPLALIS